MIFISKQNPNDEQNNRKLEELLLNRDVGFQRLLIAMEKSLQIIENDRNNVHIRITKALKDAFEMVNSTTKLLLCEVRTVLESNLKANVGVVTAAEIEDFFNRDVDLGFYNYIVLRETIIQLRYFNAAIGSIWNGIINN